MITFLFLLQLATLFCFFCPFSVHFEGSLSPCSGFRFSSTQLATAKAGLASRASPPPRFVLFVCWQDEIGGGVHDRPKPALALFFPPLFGFFRQGLTRFVLSRTNLISGTLPSIRLPGISLLPGKVSSVLVAALNLFPHSPFGPRPIGE